MEVIFIFLTATVIITTCSARIYSTSTSNGSTLSTAATIGIVVGSVVCIVIITILSVFCKKKQAKRRRINNVPTAMQMAALAQEENRYKPPGSNQVLPYSQPPRTSALNNAAQSSKMTPVS